MKNILLLLLILALLFSIILPIDSIEARMGCCSHHGGVCSCHCCDGTSLSTTCAPYYPQCGGVSMPKYKSFSAPNYKLLIPENDSSRQQSESGDFAAEASKRSNGGGFIWWILGIGIIAYIFYTLRKRK